MLRHLIVMLACLSSFTTNAKLNESEVQKGAQESSKELKVLSFNIGIVAFFDKEKYTKRANQFCDILKTAEYDVVLLQEAWHRKHRNILKDCGQWSVTDLDRRSGLDTKVASGRASGFWTNWFFYYALDYKSDVDGDSGLMILSKYELKNQQKYAFKENGSEDWLFDGEWATNKGAIAATINHPRMGEIAIFNTHLVSEYDDHSYIDQRVSQVEELVSWVDSYAGEKNVILGGDFNMAPATVPGKDNLKRTNVAWGLTRHQFLGDFIEDDFFATPGLTTYREEFSNKGESDEFKERGVTEGVIDHIFTRGNLVPSGGALHFSDTMTLPDVALSDHKGVYTVFRLPQDQVIKLD